MSKAKVHHPPRGSSKASLVQNQWRTLHHHALRARRPRPPCRTLQTPQVTSYHRTRSANRGHCLLTARCGCKVGACKYLKARLPESCKLFSLLKKLCEACLAGGKLCLPPERFTPSTRTGGSHTNGRKARDAGGEATGIPNTDCMRCCF